MFKSEIEIVNVVIENEEILFRFKWRCTLVSCVLGYLKVQFVVAHANIIAFSPSIAPFLDSNLLQALPVDIVGQ
jgi:hypothetical protein